MDTKYSTAGREWAAGERVIVVSTSQNTAGPRVLKIESVAPKSFVVDGERFRLEKLRDGVPTKDMGSGWGHYTLAVIPLDSPDAPYLLAERTLNQEYQVVAAAQRAWTKDHGIQNASTLSRALQGWIEARKAYDVERTKLEHGRGR
jgi:hypothetical protein